MYTSKIEVRLMMIKKQRPWRRKKRKAARRARRINRGK